MAESTCLEARRPCLMMVADLFLLLAFAMAMQAGIASANSVPKQPPPRALYVANFDGDDLSAHIAQLAVNPRTGALTALSPASVSTGADERFQSAAIARKKFLYVTDRERFVIWGFAINASGKLSRLRGVNPFFLPNNDCPNDVIVNPAGTVLYVSDDCNGSIDELAINARTGALTPLADSPIIAGFNIGVMAENSTGTAFYAIEMEQSMKQPAVLEFSLAGDGSLIPTGSTTGDGISLKFTNPTSIMVDPLDRFVYVSDLSGEIFEFEINENAGAGSCASGNDNVAPGCLNFIGVNSDFQCPEDLQIEPTGKYLYAADDCRGGIAYYSIVSATTGNSCANGNANDIAGCLNSLGFLEGPHASSSIFEQPVHLAIAGTFVYASDSSPQNQILQAKINMSGGAACLQTDNPDSSSVPGCLSPIGTGEVNDPLDGPRGLAILQR